MVHLLYYSNLYKLHNELNYYSKSINPLLLLNDHSKEWTIGTMSNFTLLYNKLDIMANYCQQESAA